jgi:hypothetical protein
MILLGCDPGVNGAIAAVNHNDELLDIRDLPTIELPGEGAIRRRLDGAGIVRVIRELVPADEAAIAYVEDVQAWSSGAGASSMAAMVGSKLVLFAILDLFASRIEVKPVLPNVWKAFYRLRRAKDETTSSFKARSRAAALERYPDAPITKASHDGRAEALLIAAFGRDKQGFRDDLLAEPKPAPIHVKRTDIDIDQHFGRNAA